MSMNKEQLQSKLDETLTALNSENSNTQEVGYTAISIVNDILEIDPFDIDVRILKMRLYTDKVLSNSQEIIKEAEFIIENDEFKADKMHGYDWLSWVYEEEMGMPDKAIEVIEEQLITTHSVYTKRYEIDEKEAELLNKIAFIKHHNSNTKEALTYWYASFKKYPYFHKRNAIAGMQFLEEKNFEKATELLLTHYDWCYNIEDGYRLQYGKQLKTLFDANELENQSDLIGLLFHIIRNEAAAFDLKNHLDFYDNYLPELEKQAEKHPQNSTIWFAIGNTYLNDVKNYEKALFAYTKSLEGDAPTRFSSIDRIHKCAKKTKTNFFELPLKIEGESNSLYNLMTDVMDYGRKAKKKKQQKKYTKLALEYGALAYKQYREYLIDGKGTTFNNQPHHFAMTCNNYGLVLNRYNEAFNKEEEYQKLAEVFANIHMEGYKMSPFYENITNGSDAFYEAKKYEECIKTSYLFFKEYKGDISAKDYQDRYWYIISSYKGLGGLEKVKQAYLEAKEQYTTLGPGGKGTAKSFVYNAKLYIEYALEKKKAFASVIPELEWIFTQKDLHKAIPLEIALFHYYAGICFKELNQKDKAIAHFQSSIPKLEAKESGYYFDKAEASKTFIKQLGGKVVKKKSKKSKSPFIKIWTVLTLPFVLIILVLGAFWAAFFKAFKKQIK